LLQAFTIANISPATSRNDASSWYLFHCTN